MTIDDGERTVMSFGLRGTDLVLFWLSFLFFSGCDLKEKWKENVGSGSVFYLCIFHGQFEAAVFLFVSCPRCCHLVFLSWEARAMVLLHLSESFTASAEVDFAITTPRKVNIEEAPDVN